MILRNISVESILIEDKIDKIINMYKNKDGILIQLLLDVQRELSWIPYEAIKRISEKLKIPVSQIYRVASFYTGISLKPRGRHLVRVCVGTACYVRGGTRILDSMENKLKIKSGETTNDKTFSLETVNCLGCCALGPVIEIDGQYFGKLNSEKIDKLLKNYN
ncbi:NADH-quinone oxidoreductase subunit NuoE [Candidatus Bathyarchaeota archaeon]|nr:NADH-quinone oxidoreductase subunit NuoE [Candidatus Bathyarchaeota archaeon]